ncbi:MAG: hypothetical protein PQ612_07900 [Rickettsiales bacterium]|nr:hypothetical protein [Pseudomonadota bacterium]MDA0967010.1 hypothetical protein [Pseudomonadota bacterium]MDG4543930.1 hypothetical protein [Rickettsiales bacterium]MDG4546076.1 hypothetical protein [Rickettsiales bacterium]MDG4548322.1 hypothetical protein [Rickettsiales bacterium]
MKLTLLTLICIILQSCSVSTAMKGKKTPDLSAINLGADYDTVNSILGEPDKVKTIYNGKRLHIYKRIAGLKPNMIEFVPNLILDISSLVLWEFVPYNSRKLSTYYITYDDNRKVDSINKYIIDNS